jgi:iron complex outermembrane receptor protein
VQNAPKNTETIGLTYQQRNWDLGFFSKRIGSQWNDFGSINQGIPIDPFELTNLYVNYTIKNHSEFSQTKIKFSINNLTNNESIVGVPTPASSKIYTPSAGDILTILAGRSISLALTFGYSPHH